MPRVLDMPQPYPDKEHLTRALADYIMTDNGEAIAELADAVCLMDEADNLGSIMKFGLSERTRNILAVRTEEYEQQTMPGESVSGLLPYMRIILALTERYHALVMNPPYMGGGNMNVVLSNYVKKNYEAGKADLFSVFMQVAEERLAENGKYGMINMQSWMFLSSFEKLRTHLLDTLQIDSMLHLGPRTFDELSGEVVQNTAFVVTKHTSYTTGTYFRLVDGKSCRDKERMFLAGENGYPHVFQQNFEKIPGCPIGYWVSEKVSKAFESSCIGDKMITREGMATADNDRFLRLWHEVSLNHISMFNKTSDKWYPYNKGGGFRKWFGNRDYLVNWSNDGYDIKHNIDPTTGRIRSHNYNGEYAFKKCGTWSAISSGTFAIRYCEEGFLWDSKGASGFSDNYLEYIIGLLNSKVSSKFLAVLAPTLDYKVGDIIRVPLIQQNKVTIDSLVSQNISISKSDWDAHETSWDFKENELVRLNKEQGEGSHRLSDLMDAYREHWTEQFLRLHANEEELNRQFIGIYGLEDELTPDVPLSEVTILQQGEVKVTNEYLLTTEDGSIITDETGAGLTVSGKYYLDWQDDVIAKQLISYAVGCMLGRYRLDKPGLHIAHPEPTAEEIAPYTYKGMEFAIDDDGIMPLMNGDCGFSDNAPLRMADFVRIAFGEDTQVENLNYIEKCLGKTLEQYFVKDFWKDHKKMYQNRPIYWLFASKKGVFQVIAYMHRMNAYTVERIRAKYLLPYIEHLEGEINKLDMRRTELNTKENKQLQKLQKQLDECREYHERLQVVAEQAISFDLDDGVVVNYAKFGDILAKRK